MFNGDGGGAMTGNNDVINNNKRTAVVYATEAGELYTYYINCTCYGVSKKN
jgi:hypothetical protein